MAAGQGFKNFSTGDVLTASDVNGYLMQGVWVFANATARDAAVTSPQEGNSCYLKDTDVIQVYSGSSWVTKSGSPSPLTTKGDLYTYSTTDTRLAVGTTNGHVLQVDSTAATGMKWAAVPSSGKSFSLINTGGTSLSGGATITYSGLSGYDTYLVVLTGASSASASSAISIRLNGDSAGNYARYLNRIEPGSTYSNAMFSNLSGTGQSEMLVAGMSGSASSVVQATVYITGANTSGAYKILDVVGGADAAGSNNNDFYVGKGYWNNTATVTSISAFSDVGNFDAGTMWIYGAA